MLKQIEAGVLRVSYQEWGPADGWPVFLLHGFPYDVEAYVQVVPVLIAHGARVFVPYLRGFGPTAFINSHTLRSGQQAAIAHDQLELMNALGIESAYLVGYDWGGRAACIVAALWPERVRGLLSVGSYAIQDIANALKPTIPEAEYPYWYQYYFHSERGRAGLTAHRKALCKLLWQQWSPTWEFSDATYELTSGSFENKDFVDVVIHSYRHRYGLVEGDPAYDVSEAALAQLPTIHVPTIAVDGAADGLLLTGTQGHAKRFSGYYRYLSIEGAGHNVPQETPHQLATAILRLKSVVITIDRN